MTVFRFTLLRSLRNKGTLLLLLAVPVLIIALPSMDWPALPLGYHYYGIFLLFTAAKLVHILTEDRSSGTTLRISASPISHFSYLSQNLLAFAILLIAQCLIVVIGGQFIHRDDLPAPALLLLIYTTFAFAAISLSLAWCAIIRKKESSLAILFSLIVLLAMLGGVMWPVQAMPAVLQKVAMLMPTYWYMEALQISVHGGSGGDLATSLVILMLFMIACLLYGSKRSMH